MGDQGLLVGAEGRLDVHDTTRVAGDMVVHTGRVQSGRIRERERVQAMVRSRTRQEAARHHTGTHLLHAALREVLGPHVKQYGSLVAPNRLRFDFAHLKPLTGRDLDDVQGLVNEHVLRNNPVRTDVMSIEQAVAAGALAFFGDKYGHEVRVVSIDTFSKELCGGTHCRLTGDIGTFRIVSESGVAAGVRRLEAVTGGSALGHLQQLEADMRELADILKVTPRDLVSKTKKLLGQLRERERELEQLKLRLATGEATLARRRTVRGVEVHVQRADGMGPTQLRALADSIRDKLRSGVIALGGVQDGKVALLVMVTKDLVQRVRAGDVIKALAAEVGGSGGGRPDLAQAGGKDPERLPAALDHVFALVDRAVAGPGA